MPLTIDKLKSLIRLANNNPNDNEANLAARKACQAMTDGIVEQIVPRKTAAGKLNEVLFKEYTDPKTDELVIRISKIVLHNDGNNKIVGLLKQLKAEIERPRTWNDVKRSTEPGFRSKSYDPPPNSDFDPIWEFFRNGGRNPFTGGQRGGKTNPFDNGFWDNAETKDAPTDDEWDQAAKERDEAKRKRHASNYSYDRETVPPRTPNTGRYETSYNSNMNPDGTKKSKPQALRKCVSCGLEIMTFRIKEDPWKCNFCHWGKEKI